MEPEKVRVRLLFEDQRVLRKSQKKQGLKRSWVVLDPKCHRTVSEFSNHLLHTFCLFEACPHGLSLSMDGFVLPPFESSCVLKDKDIVCVKRKKEPLLEIVEYDSEDNVCAGIEAEERAPPGPMLLANEEFQKETGGYESESEEDELEEKAEETVPEKKTSKKRKASCKSISSKSKKCKLATTEEGPLEREDEAVVSKGNDVKKRKNSDAQRTENDEQNDVNAKSMNKSKKSSEHAESKEPNEQCNISGETKKTPSRSARRKKAKRQWLREKTKLEKEEYLQLKQKQMVVAPSQKPAFTTNTEVTKGNRSEPLENQHPDENGDGVGDEVVPVEVRPGHIRFEPLDETDQDSAEVAPPAENFGWNGNMTKKKGQKWGTEKAGFSKRYAQDLNEDTNQTQSAKAETLSKGQIDFEQLVAYSGSVKKGDVITYRLIELTSSWTPEVSSFRVGKISYYDPESKKVTLMPVQEYPIEKKTEEEDDDSSMEPDTSLYKEDGSLEIEFSSLLDVRCIKTSSSNAAEVAKTASPKPVQTATNLKPSTDNGLQTPVKENGKGDPWEELSNALSAKKAELSQANNNGWNNKKGSSSGVSAWSYKALRADKFLVILRFPLDHIVPGHLNRIQDMANRTDSSNRCSNGKKLNDGMKLIIATFIGIVIGFFLGISFPTLSLTKINFPSSILPSVDIAYVENETPETSSETLLHTWSSRTPLHRANSNSLQIWVPSNPRGAEMLTPGIIAPESDYYLRRLWGLPEEDIPVKPKYLIAFTVGLSQRVNVDACVKKFSEKLFTLVLFHYDGRTTEWDQYEWSKRAIHVSVPKQTKWWYAKRFLHPDIVAPYDYIFIWDEDLGLEHFNVEECVSLLISIKRYIRLIKKHGLEISQPGVESEKKITWEITKRKTKGEVHKDAKEKPGRCNDPHLPPCAAFIEIMAPVFSREAWRCVWHMLQNDLVHGWGLDFALRKCVEPAHEKIGVVDSQWIIHQTVPSLGSQGEEHDGVAAWQGVRDRCKREWTMFQSRMASSEKMYLKELAAASANSKIP
ncbi:hypothetical protein Bca4012_061538 [Brassica carinata]